MLSRLGATVTLAVAGLVLAAAPAAAAPSIAESWVSGISGSGVDIHASVNPNGEATTVRVEYLTQAAAEANLAAVPPHDAFAGATSSPVSGTAIGSGNVAVAFNRHLSLLKAGTAYRYRVSATAPGGTVLGPARTFITQETAQAFSLPDGRGWELVSPLDKNGGSVQPPEGIFGGGVVQAAAAGGAIAYSSRFSFGEAAGAPGASQYVSRRGGAGWSTANVTTATVAEAYGDEPDGVPYQLFAPDLGRALVLMPSCEAGTCLRRYSLRGAAGDLVSSLGEPDLQVGGASPDLGEVVLSTCAALTADATEVAAPGGGCDPAAPNLYRWSGGALTLVNLLPGQTTGTPGAAVAAPGGAVGSGSVYFTVADNLYLRRAGTTVEVDAATGGGGAFQAVSADGTLAFFTAAGHLYRYVVATGTATDLTPAGGVEGVLGVSPDGQFVYYAAPGGVFLVHGAATTPVAASADASTYPPATGSARVAADGTLAFVSSASPTEYDSNGQPEVYLYAGGRLLCASCNPSGARPLGPSTIPGAYANGSGPLAVAAYKPRALSADGRRLFFDSRDALVVQDTNSDWDVYQWEAAGEGNCQRSAGCVNLISSGRGSDGATFLDAGADGADAFFLTDESLVLNDPGAADVYDARVGGGFPVPEAPIPCVGDACQPVPSPPEDPSPGTGFYRGEANPPLTWPKSKEKKKRHGKRKAGKHRAHGKPNQGKRGGKGRAR